MVSFTRIVFIESRESISKVKNIKKIIGVASGKGGVGKSTVALNLALALKAQGAKVGILDADIYGPSQPMMLGSVGVRPVVENGLQPVVRLGLQSMSIGYLIDPTAPMVWRGPMIGKALQQMLEDTQWDALDYLVVDLPPGTGDIQLTLCQKVAVSGIVMVTTPQDLALSDVKRACEMFQKMNVPILGVVENMSMHTCTHCGHEEAIFGSNGGSELAAQYQLTLLGSLPLDANIRLQTDHGEAPVVKDPAGKVAQVFMSIADKVKAQLDAQPKNYSHLFSKIVVEKKE